MNVGDESARDPRDDGQASAVRPPKITSHGSVVRLVDRPLVLQARLSADYRQHGAYRAIRPGCVLVDPDGEPLPRNRHWFIGWRWNPRPQDAPGSTLRPEARV